VVPDLQVSEAGQGGGGSRAGGRACSGVSMPSVVQTSMSMARICATMASTRAHCPAPTCEGPRHAAPMQKRVLPAALARLAACGARRAWGQGEIFWLLLRAALPRMAARPAGHAVRRSGTYARTGAATQSSAPPAAGARRAGRGGGRRRWGATVC